MKKLLMVLSLLLLTLPLTAQDFRPEFWSVGHAAVFQDERMEVVFVYPTTFPKTLAVEYVTLAEGMENGTVEVTEIKPGLIRGRDRPNQYEVVLLNNSGKHLILLAGEILAGGNQDRVIAEDRIVPPDDDPVLVSVLCAQRNRWRGQTLTFKTTDIITSPSVRGNVLLSDQPATWDSIAAASAAGPPASEAVVDDATAELLTATTGAVVLSANSIGTTAWTFDSTGSAYIAVEAKKTEGELAIEKELKELRPLEAIGAVLVLDGKAVSSDVFATNKLFGRYWSKLVRSYVIEARRLKGRGAKGKIEQTTKGSCSPAVAGVRGNVTINCQQNEAVMVSSGYIADGEGDYDVRVKPSVYSLSRLKHEGTTATVLRSLAEAGSPLLHYTKLRK